MQIFGDFETQSEYDLRAGNSDGYAKHRSTEAMCLAVAFDDGPVHLWKPGEPLPTKVFKALQDGAEFWGHNVGGFEWYIWNYVCAPKYGFPKLEIDQCFDTMAMANAMGLPGSLNEACAAVGLDKQKNDIGYRTMMMLCKPDAYGVLATRESHPDAFKILYEYCKEDVVMERELKKRLRPLLPIERKIWLMDQRINQRGVGVDIESVKAINIAVENEKSRLLSDFHRVTANQVPTPASHAKFKKWLGEQGVVMMSIAKDKITKELEKKEKDCEACKGSGTYDYTDEWGVEHKEIDCETCLGLGVIQAVPPLAREAILIRQEFAKSSNAKLKAMINCVNGGRLRNMFEYYGARQTARWAGRTVQLHNMPRTKMKFADIEYAIEAFKQPQGAKALNLIHGSAMQVASECLRSMLTPAPGCKFIAADWSNIEGRVLAWLANEVWKTKAFADFDKGTGPDIYKLSYSMSFHILITLITDDMRQIGKTCELAFGYQGSVGAFHTMAKTLGVKVTDARAKELTTAWRAAHPRIVQYWKDLEEAAINAIDNPGAVYAVGDGPRKVLYKKSGSFLCCTLPGGRVMYYPYPRYEEIDAPWGGKKMGITYMQRDSEKKIFVRVSTYGGKLCENIVQGFSREILAHGMLRVEEKGYPIVIHVHDEPVSEVPIKGPHSVKEFENLLSITPSFAPGLPLAAKGWEGFRYRKA